MLLRRTGIEQNPWLPAPLDPEEEPQLPGPLQTPAPAGLTTPPRGLDFMALAHGEQPTIYLTEGAREKPEITRAMHHLATAHPLAGVANPDAWEDLLAAAGRSATVYVVDRAGERWGVMEVLWDPGGETGQLRLRHLGPRSRGGQSLLVDLQEAFGYMIPVVVYKSPRRHESPSVRWLLR